jgi:hypothetical protein
MDFVSDAANPDTSKRIVKFNSIPLSRAIIALAILALLGVLSFVGFTIVKDGLALTEWFGLAWLSGCSIILATGIVYLNLAGQAEIESPDSTPLTQLLLSNLFMIVTLGLVLFFLSLAFF